MAVTEPLKLTSAQQQMLVSQNLSPDDPLYNAAFLFLIFPTPVSADTADDVKCTGCVGSPDVLDSGIKTKDLDSIKTCIMSDATLHNDFDACVNLFQDFISQDASTHDVTVAAVKT